MTAKLSANVRPKVGPWACFAAGLVCLGMPAPSLAQSIPDAGRVLQEQKSPPGLPGASSGLQFEQSIAVPVAPGGSTVVVRSVLISGNSAIASAALVNILSDAIGKSFDLEGLRGLADRISAVYRAAGYPFARAFLPPQSIAEGELRIEVLEGRYSAIRAISEDDTLRAGSQAMLSQIKAGNVIESGLLERITLTLGDQPGVKVTPIIRPGKEIGTGDLDVRVERTPSFSGDVGFDNHGNRFTGESRLRANFQWDSPFAFGDQVTLRGLYSKEGLWLGSMGYSLPLGSSGLRGNAGYAQTYYKLAKDFAGQGEGTAKVISLGMSYPLVRSQIANLNLAGTFQRKQLDDRKVLTAEEKSSDSLSLSLGFDRRDGLWGGGINYGSLVGTYGRLSLDSALENVDRTSGQNERGNFGKWNFDVARVQAIQVANFSLFGRLSTQWAGKNLDSSESFSLGGPNGVRAYPSGEGNGDEGWLMQLEIRYAMGAMSPYVFHDAGGVKINANNGGLVTPANPNSRFLGGEGFGVRYSRDRLSLDANVSWRSQGGKPQADMSDRNPRVWVTMGHRF